MKLSTAGIHHVNTKQLNSKQLQSYCEKCVVGESMPVFLRMQEMRHGTRCSKTHKMTNSIRALFGDMYIQMIARVVDTHVECKMCIELILTVHGC